MTGTLDLTPNSVFADQFRVIRPLAKGGMGAVYVVEQLGTGRERALKLMHRELVDSDRALERFAREAQVASKIDSDHVVEVIGAGVDTRTGMPWICMELLRGETLAERLAHHALSIDEVRSIVKQLGHALLAAHRAGVVHRDLKPENLFLATSRLEGQGAILKVLDFGVAAFVKDREAASTTTQAVGSPMWMAPEQTNVGRVTPATDVWAFGLLAFYLLTGQTYWRTPRTPGSTLTALLVEIMVDPLVPASTRAAELGLPLPSTFDTWFSQVVVREVEKRANDIERVTAGLVAILDGRASTSDLALAPTMASMPPMPVESRPVAVAASTLPQPMSPPPAKRSVGRRALFSVFLGIGGLGAALLVALQLTQRLSAPPDSGASAAATVAPVIAAPPPAPMGSAMESDNAAPPIERPGAPVPGAPVPGSPAPGAPSAVAPSNVEQSAPAIGGVEGTSQAGPRVPAPPSANTPVPSPRGGHHSGGGGGGGGDRSRTGAGRALDSIADGESSASSENGRATSAPRPVAAPAPPPAPPSRSESGATAGLDPEFDEPTPERTRIIDLARQCFRDQYDTLPTTRHRWRVVSEPGRIEVTGVPIADRTPQEVAFVRCLVSRPLPYGRAAFVLP